MGIDLNKPLFLGDSQADDFLRGLQGNILRSHRRNEAVHLFVSFGSPNSAEELEASCRKAQEWIRTLLERGDITTAFDEKETSPPQGTFLSLLLSSEGYSFLEKKRPVAPAGGPCRWELLPCILLIRPRRSSSECADPTLQHGIGIGTRVAEP